MAVQRVVLKTAPEGSRWLADLVGESADVLAAKTVQGKSPKERTKLLHLDFGLSTPLWVGERFVEHADEKCLCEKRGSWDPFCAVHPPQWKWPEEHNE